MKATRAAESQMPPDTVWISTGMTPARMLVVLRTGYFSRIWGLAGILAPGADVVFQE